MERSKGFPYTVAECEQRLKAADEAAFALLEPYLADDRRRGVQAALARARRRLEAEAAERERVQALYDQEAKIVSAQGGSLALGLDEVGRGALAGPLAVGGVVVDPRAPVEGINDSKLLTPARRFELAQTIKAKALGWAVCYVSAPTIDRVGIVGALRIAFRRIIALFERRGCAFDVVLLDGLPLKLDDREVAIVSGDRTCASIACASIVAKVHRDQLMERFDSIYPGYDFASSKGYGSERHRLAIESRGLCPIHRQSFCSRWTQPSLFDAEESER